MIGVMRKSRGFPLFAFIKIFCIHNLFFELSKYNILFTQIIVRKKKENDFGIYLI